MAKAPGTPSPKKTLRPICLDAGPPGLWRISGKGNAPPEYKEVFDKVVARDNNFCVYCGFRCATQESVKLNGIEIHSLDGYDDHLEVDNFVTSCNLCRMDFNLEYAGSEQKALLVYIPELSQALINNIARAIMFVRHEVDCERKNLAEAEAAAQAQAQQQGGVPASMLNDALGAGNRQSNDAPLRNLIPVLDAAESLYATMKARASYVEELIGTSRPEVLGRAIIAIRNAQDMSEDRELLTSAQSVTSEFREKFSEYNDRLDSEFGPKGEVPNTDIDDILQGIRVLPTQPGCEPEAWGRPGGAFMISMPPHWLNSYQNMLNKIEEQGLSLDLPEVSPAVGSGAPASASEKSDTNS